MNTPTVNIDWMIVDGIGPFFHDYKKRRINWSKIPLTDLPVEGEKADIFWQKVRLNMAEFVTRVQQVGYNTITLDDIAHVVPLDDYDDILLTRITRLREEMKAIINIIKQAGLRVLMSTDVMPMAKVTENRLNGDREAMEAYFAKLLETFMDDFPEVDGIVMRLGEADGNDVKGKVRNELFIKTTKQGNRILKRILPSFEKRNKVLICRTWTVGAYPIGDLIWNQRRLTQFLKGIHSDHFILSMKYGGSDFFRYLPTNQAFFHHSVKKIVEFQARREYEGAGEYPNFIGFNAEKTAQELQSANNLVGASVWVQTGGWHAFHRISYIGKGSPWVEINSQVIVNIFQRGISARQTITEIIGKDKIHLAADAIHFFELIDQVVSEALYIKEFSQQSRYFRRVRIPPIIHAYWDCIFFIHPMKTVMSHFVKDGKKAIQEAHQAMALFPEIQSLAEKLSEQLDSLGWEVSDIHFMRDTFQIFTLAREYYFSPSDPAIEQKILEAKTNYKSNYPRSSRSRFRLKTDFTPSPLNQKILSILTFLLTRNQSNYRLTDHIFTIRILGTLYRLEQTT